MLLSHILCSSSHNASILHMCDARRNRNMWWRSYLSRWQASNRNKWLQALLWVSRASVSFSHWECERLYRIILCCFLDMHNHTSKRALAFTFTALCQCADLHNAIILKASPLWSSRGQCVINKVEAEVQTISSQAKSVGMLHCSNKIKLEGCSHFYIL